MFIFWQGFPKHLTVEGSVIYWGQNVTVKKDNLFHLRPRPRYFWSKPLMCLISPLSQLPHPLKKIRTASINQNGIPIDDSAAGLSHTGKMSGSLNDVENQGQFSNSVKLHVLNLVQKYVNSPMNSTSTSLWYLEKSWRFFSACSGQLHPHAAHRWPLADLASSTVLAQKLKLFSLAQTVLVSLWSCSVQLISV